MCECLPKGQAGHASFMHCACRDIQQKYTQSKTQCHAATIPGCAIEVCVLVLQYIEQFKSLSDKVTSASVRLFRNTNTTPTVVSGVDLIDECGWYLLFIKKHV
ncbi:hypothetical protein ATANTOWER_002832 [Ataeniobius toweri]|uniref:Uncharacterized protein n=1 Tax=Ataeniobius toweri TaxID=208326 RepID=A0ABU7AD96_9TELE|nr:hypothetical protein [Ataeniobius toweri]